MRNASVRWQKGLAFEAERAAWGPGGRERESPPEGDWHLRPGCAAWSPGGLQGARLCPGLGCPLSLICLEPQHRLEEEKQYPVAQVWAWLTASWECSPGAGTPLCLRPPPLGHRAHLLAVGPACLVPGCALLEGRSIEQLLCAGQGTGDVEGTRQAEASSGFLAWTRCFCKLGVC